MKAVSTTKPGTLHSFPGDFFPSYYDFNDLITFKNRLEKESYFTPTGSVLLS